MAKCSLRAWVEETFKHVTLCDSMQSPKNPAAVIKIPEINIDLTIGLISTEDINEFRDLCLSYAPVGTIKDDLDKEWYELKMLRVRQLLSKMLISEKSKALADKYLKVLERRDRKRWSDQKGQMTASVNDGDGRVVSLTYQVL